MDTSLNLNIKPLRILSEPLLKQEEAADINFINYLGRTSDSVEDDEKEALIEELHRMSAENKKLTEMLTATCHNYTRLRNQFMITTTTTSTRSNIPSVSRKRKFIGGSSDTSSTDHDDPSKKLKPEILKDNKISRVHVRTEAPSDTSLIVKDGYQWRKYGQKVTRDNPSPRAYFKCSFAPTCPVKKKVQRSIEDQSILVATYEGEHNHPHPSKPDSSSTTSNRNSSPAGKGQPCSSGPNKSNIPQETRNPGTNEAPEVLQQHFVEHMASTLTNDPGFKAALAAAISGKFLQQDTRSENWY